MKYNYTKSLFLAACMITALSTPAVADSGEFFEEHLNLHCDLVSYNTNSPNPYRVFIGVREVPIYHATENFPTWEAAVNRCREIASWSCGNYASLHGLQLSEVSMSIIQSMNSLLSYVNSRSGYPTVSCDNPLLR